VRGRSNSPDDWRRWTEAVSGFSARTTGQPAHSDAASIAARRQAFREIAKAFERTRAHVLQFDAGTLRDRWIVTRPIWAFAIWCKFDARQRRQRRLTTKRKRNCCGALSRTPARPRRCCSAKICAEACAGIVAGDLHILPNLNLLKCSRQFEAVGASWAKRAYGFEQWTAKANAEDEFAVPITPRNYSARFEPPR